MLRCSFFSGSAAQIFVEIIIKYKNKPCKGEIIEIVIKIALLKELKNTLPDTNDY